MTMPGFERPMPVKTPTGAPFWDALARHEIAIQYSPSARSYVFYPRVLAPRTLADDLEWRTISGMGTLYTYTVARRPVGPHFADAVPQLLAIVEWDEGPRFSTEMVNVEPEDLSVGMRVRPVFFDYPEHDVTMPVRTDGVAGGRDAVRGIRSAPMLGAVTVLDSPIPRFHLAVPVDDLAAATRFYGTVLGLERGRSAETWVDWNLGGHQVVTHLAPGRVRPVHNPVDGHDVPVPHFGLILAVPEFAKLAGRLRAAGVEFVIEPYVRFEGEAGEQWTMFLLDPAGNALEFKAFDDDSQVFAS